MEKQHQREERRKQKHLQKIRQQESTELTRKIRSEEKKLMKAQRKIESVRLIEALFDRIKVRIDAEIIYAIINKNNNRFSVEKFGAR